MVKKVVYASTQLLQSGACFFFTGTPNCLQAGIEPPCTVARNVPHPIVLPHDLTGPSTNNYSRLFLLNRLYKSDYLIQLKITETTEKKKELC